MYIYCITNKTNNKKYIGQTNDLNRRWKEHCNYNKNQNQAISRAIKKYGKSNFEIEILEECKVENVNNKEIKWIKKYNTYKGYGYNCHIGGLNHTGINHPLCKIDKTTALKILKDRKNKNKTHRELSKKFKINRKTIGKIITGDHGICNQIKWNYYEDKLKNKIKSKSKIKKILKDRKNKKVGYKKLKEKYGLSNNTIKSIINGEHKLIKENDSLKKLVDKNILGIPSNNKSGTRGVTYVESRNRWLARIMINGKRKHLGYFKDKNEAIKVRKKAEKTTRSD